MEQAQWAMEVRDAEWVPADVVELMAVDAAVDADTVIVLRDTPPLAELILIPRTTWKHKKKNFKPSLIGLTRNWENKWLKIKRKKTNK